MRGGLRYGHWCHRRRRHLDRRRSRLRRLGLRDLRRLRPGRNFLWRAGRPGRNLYWLPRRGWNFVRFGLRCRRLGDLRRGWLRRRFTIRARRLQRNGNFVGPGLGRFGRKIGRRLGQWRRNVGRWLADVPPDRRKGFVPQRLQCAPVDRRKRLVLGRPFLDLLLAEGEDLLEETRHRPPRSGRPGRGGDGGQARAVMAGDEGLDDLAGCADAD